VDGKRFLRIWREVVGMGRGDEWGVVWLCVSGWRLPFFFPLLRGGVGVGVGVGRRESGTAVHPSLSHSNCYWCWLGGKEKK